MTIEGDSGDYDLLSAWSDKIAKRFAKKPAILTAEIGVRKGLGSKLIMNYVRGAYKNAHFHIGIDPYGDLKYKHYDKGEAVTMDYDQKMLTELKKDFAEEKRFTLFNTTDEHFMDKYFWGVEFFDEGKQYLINEYALVHFDGPHNTSDGLVEAVFFAKRSAPGSVFIFDDWKTYKSSVVRDCMREFGFEFISNGQRKMVMERTDG